jgi:cytochrome o ubiquinol oxidase subunit III
MSDTTLHPAPDADPYHIGHASHLRQPAAEHATSAPASRRIVVAYGFWIFLISDVILFAGFFAAYAVLSGNTAGGPSGREVFSLSRSAIETVCLLLSSFTAGVANIGARMRSLSTFYGGMAVTGLLGVTFLALEIGEFSGMIARGWGPSQSAFLSTFFALVGCHGLHVTVGMVWLLVLIGQVFTKGFRDDILRRFLCFGLFWHTLDIIWVGIFTVVYLMAFTT